MICPCGSLSNKQLIEFSADHPDAEIPLQMWRKLIESDTYAHLANLKAVLNAVDKAGDYYVFDIGNKYRLIATIHMNTPITKA